MAGLGTAFPLRSSLGLSFVLLCNSQIGGRRYCRSSHPNVAWVSFGSKSKFLERRLRGMLALWYFLFQSYIVPGEDKRDKLSEVGFTEKIV